MEWTLAAAAVVWAMWVYDRLVRLRNEIGNAFAQIDVQLERRYDLVPHLVEVAPQYLQHERESVEAVTAARQAERSSGSTAPSCKASSRARSATWCTATRRSTCGSSAQSGACDCCSTWAAS